MPRRFQNVIKINPPTWIKNVVHFDVLSQQEFDPIIVVELLELKEKNYRIDREN